MILANEALKAGRHAGKSFLLNICEIYCSKFVCVLGEDAIESVKERAKESKKKATKKAKETAEETSEAALKKKRKSTEL